MEIIVNPDPGPAEPGSVKYLLSEMDLSDMSEGCMDQDIITNTGQFFFISSMNLYRKEEKASWLSLNLRSPSFGIPFSVDIPRSIY